MGYQTSTTKRTIKFVKMLGTSIVWFFTMLAWALLVSDEQIEEKRKTFKSENAYNHSVSIKFSMGASTILLLVVSILTMPLVFLMVAEMMKNESQDDERDEQDKGSTNGAEFADSNIDDRSAMDAQV